MIGKTVYHYQILEKIGVGAMGVVYKARDLTSDRDVALKFFPPGMTIDPVARERFLQEAKAASSINHPNICAVYGIEEARDGQLFIAMAFYEGETLDRKIRRGTVSVDDAVGFASQIALGLSEAHEHGIVHRDIKPSNVLVTTDKVVKILDFGLAKLDRTHAITKSGSRLGTAPYMSPEQVRAERVDFRADIWSLGIVLYEMLAGRVPFSGENEAAIMYSVVNDDLPDLQTQRADIPSGLQLVVTHALSKAKTDRYESMRQFAADLESLKVQTAAKRATVAERAASAKARRQTLRKAALAFLSLLAVVGVFALIRLLSGWEAPVSGPVRVLATAFENQSGDTTLNYLQTAIPLLLETCLEQSPYVHVLTQERARDLLLGLGKSPPKYLDVGSGKELCPIESIGSLIAGSFTQAGNLFVSNIRMLDPVSGKVLKTAESRGQGVESFLSTQIDELGREAQVSMGLTQQQLQQNDRPISQMLTSSPQALQWFCKGKESEGDSLWKDAVQCYRAAVHLDSSFAAAYRGIFICEEQLGNSAQAADALRKAREWSWRTSDKTRLLIEAESAGTIEKDPQKQRSILAEVAKRFPFERVAH